MGFDWPEVNGVFDKIKEEISELEQAMKEKNQEAIEFELGDFFFSLVNFSRFQNISAEDALRKSINKFTSRFQYVERRLKELNKSVYDSSLEEMDTLWEESKNKI